VGGGLAFGSALQSLVLLTELCMATLRPLADAELIGALGPGGALRRLRRLAIRDCSDLTFDGITAWSLPGTLTSLKLDGCGQCGRQPV
jgi:hypothetical protein